MDPIIIMAIGCSTTFFFSVPFIFFAYLRYLRYKETVVLAEQGMIRPETHRNGNGTRRWGMIFLFLGLALTVGLWPVGFMIDAGFLGLGPWMLPGLIPFFFGCALLAIAETEHPSESNHSDSEPIPPSKANHG
jgi:hypothetical protein